MKKVIRIENIVLNYGMWWTERDRANQVVAETERTIDGTLLVFEQLNRVSAQNITLESRDDGWQTEAKKDAIINLSNSSIGADVEIEFSDGTTRMCRFAYEVSDGSVQFEPLYDGSEWFKGKVYLALV